MNKDHVALNGHFIRHQVIDEILLQLEVYKKYAKKVGQNQLANTYDHLSEFFTTTKNQLAKDAEENGIPRNDRRDRIMVVIRKYLQEIFEEAPADSLTSYSA